MADQPGRGWANLIPGENAPREWQVWFEGEPHLVASSGALSITVPTGQLINRDMELSSGGSHPVNTMPSELWTENSRQPYAVALFLRAAPFWLDKPGTDWLPGGIDPDEFQGLLIRYRLAEICLRALPASPMPIDNAAQTERLLQRQRYRYLTALQPADDAEDPMLSSYLPKYPGLVRAARVEWYEALINQTDDTALAFEQAKPPTGDAWDMEAEIRHLVFYPSGHHPAPYAFDSAADRRLSDIIIRRGFLARNNLPDANHAVAAYLADERLRAWLPRFHHWFILWAAVAAGGFWLAGNGWLPRGAGGWVVPAAAVPGLGLPVAFWVALWRNSRLKKAILYPPALRVPGLALLGGLVVASGMFDYLAYAVNAWDTPWAAWLLAIGAPLVTFIYITSETLARTNDSRVAGRRALLLTAYLWSAVFWLAVLVGWLAGAMGMAVCAGSGQWRFVTMPGGVCVSMDLVFIIASLALLIGLLTQLFWEDKSVAEPL